MTQEISHVVKSEEDSQRLQDEIDQLVKWAEEWQREFNYGKCKAMQIGITNKGKTYTMNIRVLDRAEKWRKSGV